MSSAYYLSICVLCAYYLQWPLISSCLTDNANVIHTSSLVLFIYSIMENMSSAPLPDDVSSTPLPDDMSSAPLPDDMSSALQRNRSYLFEVWEASNRSTRQLVWFIWLFWLISLVSLTFWVFEFLGLESSCNGIRGVLEMTSKWCLHVQITCIQHGQCVSVQTMCRN